MLLATWQNDTPGTSFKVNTIANQQDNLEMLWDNLGMKNKPGNTVP